MRDRFMVTKAALDDAAVSNADLGAWLRLHCYCAMKFNGGRIPACKAWRTVEWAKHTALERRDVEAVVKANLAAWEGDDLVLAFYDIEGEALYSARSAGGRLGAERRWAGKRKSDVSGGGEPHGSGHGLPNGSPNGSSVDEPDAQGQVQGQFRANPSPGRSGVPPRATVVDPERTYQDRVHGLLARHALKTSPRALLEWIGHLENVACCDSFQDAEAYLDWAVPIVRKHVPLPQYHSEFVILGQEWNNGERERQRRAQA